MTKWIDPARTRILLLVLLPVVLIRSALARLTSVTDALGQVTTIHYLSDDTQTTDPDYFLIDRITDPFGRYASFEYYDDGQLWKIHDAIGIVSEFHYEDRRAILSIR